MRISDQVTLAARNLTRRKGRTALTVVGVVVGTCAVIVMISLGIATSRNQQAMLEEWGDLTQIEIYGGGYVEVTPNGDATEHLPALLDDAGVRDIQALDHVVAATPYYRSYYSASIYGGRGDRYEADSYNIMGVYPDALEPMGFALSEGVWLNQAPAVPSGKIPVLVCAGTGYNFEDTRRSFDSPKRRRYMGQTDEMGNELPPFVDVYKDKLTLTITNDDETNPKEKSWQLVPVGTLVEDDAKGWWTQDGIVMRVQDLKMVEQEFYKLIGDRYEESAAYDEVYVKVDDVDNVDDVTEALNEMGFENTYSISDQREQMQAQVARNQLMLGGLAAVSLLVAALNIANTMTMAIYERTREIGVMKVLGCELGNIRRMFLIESGCIGMLGGVVGALLSLLISFVLNHLMVILLFLQSVFGAAFDIEQILGEGYYYMGEDNILSVVPPWLVLAAVAFATVIGLVSGLAPANRAVKISALEAIRHD